MKNFSQKGVIVIIAFLALGILLLLGAYLLSFSTVESKISKSQEVSMKTYYLAEAGIQEAIWKLKNDQTWYDNFETEPGCESWQGSFTRNYLPDSVITVSVQNTECAKGEIVATSTIALPQGKTAQRVVKIQVLKAVGTLTEDSPVFAGAPSGESTIQASLMNIYNGNIFVNNNLNIQFWSTVNVAGKALVVGNSNIVWSILNAESICAKNLCYTTSTCQCQNPEKFERCTSDSCPPKAVDMPIIDFDSVDPNSYKSRAQSAQTQGQCSVKGENYFGAAVLTSNHCLFSEHEFEDMFWQIGSGGKLILEHKTNGLAVSTYYIEGGINLKGGRKLEINGILLADGTINIGEQYGWGGYYGFNQLIINDPGLGFPSGLLTKGKMNFGAYFSFVDVAVAGLIYSQDEMRLTSLPHSFTVAGGIIARKFSLTSGWSPLNIYLDNDIIREGVWGSSTPPEGGSPPYSPVVTVEHWEESY